jgi:hypothetical protein
MQHGDAIFISVSSQRMCCWALLEGSFAADWNSACHFVCGFCLCSDFKLPELLIYSRGNIPNTSGIGTE